MSHGLGHIRAVRDLHASSIGVTTRTEHGDIVIVEHVRLEDQFGVAVPTDDVCGAFRRITHCSEGLGRA